MKIRTLYTSRQRGFTLLEMIMAATIAAAVLASMLATFQTSIQAYRMGIGHGENVQSARYIMSQISSDLRNMFYLDPNEYNKYRRQVEQQLSSQLEAALQSGMSEKDFYETQDVPELGPELDLSFFASDGGDTDSFSFIYSQHFTRFDDRMPWSLARVSYAVEDGKLMRQLANCFAAPTDALGNEIAAADQPPPDLLADNVEKFDLEFGYWYDGDWLIATDWDSKEQTYRNPAPEDTIEALDASGNPVATELTAAQKALNPTATSDSTQMQNLPDNVPAWVRITLTIADRLKPERKRTYTQLVQLYNSQETFIPQDDTDSTVRSRKTSSSSRSSSR